MEDGSRFGHFWWFYARVYYVYILVDQPCSDRNLMVLWAKAPGFKARHFVVLWFNPQSSQKIFHKIYFPLFSIFFFYLWKILLLCFLKNFPILSKISLFQIFKKIKLSNHGYLLLMWRPSRLWRRGLSEIGYSSSAWKGVSKQPW